MRLTLFAESDIAQAPARHHAEATTPHRHGRAVVAGRKETLTDHRASSATNTQIDTEHPASQEGELGSSGLNQADPFLVRGDELPDLTDEQWTALVEIGKAGGGLACDAAVA